MSLITRQRFFLACAVLMTAQALFADNPAARHGAQLGYSTRSTYSVLFGGGTAIDGATRKAYELADTWVWAGDRWIRVYPAHSPSARAHYSFAYDSRRDRFVLFGGRAGTQDFNETWAFDGKDWTRIQTETAPPARVVGAMTYDAVRDRMILYGGSTLSPDQKSVVKFFDTWEFDGTNWARISENTPQVETPSMVYDIARGHATMMGVDSTQKSLMYRFDGAQRAWVQMTPAAVPVCVAGANMAYNAHDEKIVLYGGVCAAAASTDTWEFDGTTWTSKTSTLPTLASPAMTYDASRRQVVLFGGNIGATTPQSGTYLYRAGAWAGAGNAVSPSPRSLAAFRTNPTDGFVWLYSGVNEFANIDEFWKFANASWEKLSLENGPTGCTTPASAYDTDRKKLVVLCDDNRLFEWDHAAWKEIKDLKSAPPIRRFSNMVYDATIKKTVLMGGFDDLAGGFLDHTWLWDGTAWTRQKNKPPTRRGKAAMWYDPVARKTFVFGGIGQKERDGRFERFNDMWSFDGTGWTQVNQGSTVPAPRYGAQAEWDPRTNTLLLFGGLRLDTSGTTQVQVYANDTWQWDGTKWTELRPANVPPARENGSLAFDPVSGQMVLYGGWSGYFHGDLWVWTGTDWQLRPEPLPSVTPPSRRRGVL